MDGHGRGGGQREWLHGRSQGEIVTLRTHIAVEHADGADARLEGNADHADVVLGRRHLAGTACSVSTNPRSTQHADDVSV